jgi:hypothetical protein
MDSLDDEVVGQRRHPTTATPSAQRIGYEETRPPEVPPRPGLAGEIVPAQRRRWLRRPTPARQPQPDVKGLFHLLPVR